MQTLRVSSESGKLPRYAHEGDACFDIEAIDDVTIPPGEAGIIPTGLRFEIPRGHALMVYSRSGHGFLHGVRLGNCVGVIDHGYRGELRICLRNDGHAPYVVKSGSRVAQAMLIEVPSVRMLMVDDVSNNTSRGEGGFGSTGGN